MREKITAQRNVANQQKQKEKTREKEQRKKKKQRSIGVKQKLSTQLAAGFGILVFITIFLISLSANVLIRHQFEKNISERQNSFSEELAEALALQYHAGTGEWNLDYIHGFGMYALKDGYIIKVYDRENHIIWDAENHDMTACHQMMQEISARMQEKRPDLNGRFLTHRYELKQSGQDADRSTEYTVDGEDRGIREIKNRGISREFNQGEEHENETIGYLDVSYYSPYYFDENDFKFLDSMNQILFLVGISSMAAAVAAGVLLARRLSVPIAKMTEITEKISEGNYAIRFESDVHTRELAQLSTAVNQMAERLETQETLRRRLTSDVAHELRTPIANISSYLEAILEGVWEPTPERLENCYGELERISDLIGDLEKLRQIESEKMNLEKENVDLLELCRSVQAAFEPELEKKHLRCTVSGENAVVIGDQKRLHQAIFNLVSNAVKYSDPGGKIEIRVGWDEEDHVVAEVKDHGIGIPEKDLPLIFERFYRTDRSRNRKTGGAGIGLAITKAIVHAHGGNILAESRENFGSTFKIILPKEN